MEQWREDALATAVLYAIIERGVDFPTASVQRDVYAYPVFNRMKRQGLLEVESETWRVTPKGRTAMKGAVQSHDILRQMEIFARVDVARVLQPDELAEDGTLRSDIYDPRFRPEDGEGQDMRLAMISWLAETVGKQPADLKMIVFLQKLGSGKLAGSGLWRRLSSGEIFDEIDRIVDTAYKWQEMAPGDLEASAAGAKALYSAGILEQRKREGSNCGGCNMPLVLYEEFARSEGKTLEACPGCGRVFGALPPPGSEGTLQCPKCNSVIFEGDARCGGCGALIDFSLPMGTVQTDTVAETTTVYSTSYGYTSYGWLNPWDPYADVVAVRYLYYSPWLL